MSAWWAGLAPRERIVLAGGAMLLVLVVLWLMIWEPLAQKREQLRADISALTADLSWMEQVASQVKRRAAQQGSASNGAAAGGSVLTLVEVSARAAGLRESLERVQPEGQGARLWFNETSFDGLLRWLAELEQRHGLQISQLAVDAGTAPGVVSARVLVEPRQ
ncbi:Type II secretion system protein M [Pseudomonas saudimassiliensis]|uniref:Type II secretion system protein M n=1 Tax=Pseudomonas saudimassiliensis TaxID=1461581 RepID=A0A078MBV0_9PSED|nr:type II secretion system protein M [Pseudomonas saudimassiliensis]CEA02136.1 Type II secretion system protein M [Pseudomonas saudimassiliensis]CEF25742.1 Type II secretion system protein M [Pseudomonas saudimassiliensis]